MCSSRDPLKVKLEDQSSSGKGWEGVKTYLIHRNLTLFVEGIHNGSYLIISKDLNHQIL